MTKKKIKLKKKRNLYSMLVFLTNIEIHLNYRSEDIYYNKSNLSIFFNLLPLFLFLFLLMM